MSRVFLGESAGVADGFDGQSLSELLRGSTTLSIDVVLRIGIDVAAGLTEIHARGKIHGSIHPGNVQVDRATGAARLDESPVAFPPVSSRGADGLPIPLPYVSPEQTGRMDRAVDWRTDLYSFGATLYHMLCGAPPFQEADELALIHSHMARPPAPPHERDPRVSVALSGIVLKLLAKNAQDRYRSARGVRADLEECARRLRSTGTVGEFPLGGSDAPEDLEIPQRLFGREAERDALLQAYGSATIGSKLLLLVSGPAGVGKSSLVRQVQLLVARQRGFFIAGKFDQLHRNIPYSALGQALEELARLLLAEPEEELKRWKERLLSHLRPNAQLVIGLAPLFEKVIGKQPPLQMTGSLESQNRFNVTLQRLVSLFARPDHPLVLFLDDLQWVDPATLAVLQTLMTSEREPTHLLVIGAHRENEVGCAHPLSAALAELGRAGVEIRNVRLQGLAPEHVADLVAATLYTPPEEARDLAALVSEKTGGNPFFIDSFLRALREEKALFFRPDAGAWGWDIPAIRRLVDELGVGGDVVDLVLRKVRREAAPTQRALRVAACIGNRFSASTIAGVTGTSLADTIAALEPAKRERLVVPVDDDEYRFFHDRVQQAALLLTPDEQRAALHREIGRALLRDTPAERRDERLFETVDQLDLGLPVTSDADERAELARLNLRAGRKAKAATAYLEAQRYLRTGISLLRGDPWETDYAAAFELHFVCSECEYLLGRFDEANALFALLLGRARTPLEKANVYAVRVVLESNRSRYGRALELGQEGLSLLGHSLPRDPADWALAEVWRRRVADKRAEDFAALPELADDTLRAVLATLVALAPSVYFIDSRLLAWLILRCLTLCLDHGNARHSAVVYVMYAMPLLLEEKDPEKAHAFGRLGLSLADRLAATELQSKVLHIFGTFVSHCRDHARKGIELLRMAVQYGLENGDLLFASYAAANIAIHCAIVGDPLDDVYREAEACLRFVRQYRYREGAAEILPIRQLALALQGKIANPTSLGNETLDEAHLAAELQASQNRLPLLVYVLAKLQLLYLFGHPQQAGELALEYDPVFDAWAGSTLRLPEFAFYACLCAVENLRQGSGQADRLKELLRKRKTLLERWAESAPSNFLHKALLIAAEVADLEGASKDAAALYDDAIREARLAGYRQNAALASERAGLAYRRRCCPEIALVYLEAAHTAWLQWGATAKAHALELSHPELAPRGRRDGAREGRGMLDLSSVLRATRAMSSEIDLEKLLAQVLRIVVENAGAERGALIMESAGALRIEAALHLGFGEPDAHGGADLAGSERAPEGIVRYVYRTGQSVVLADASREPPYRLDPYVQRRQSRSLLCVPVRHQDRTTGVLFLENSLTAGAFTQERVELLRLLVSQASISLENARLFDSTRKLNESLERENRERQRAEVALRASEAKLVELLEGLPVGVLVVEPGGTISFSNRAAKQILERDKFPPVGTENFTTAYQMFVHGTDDRYPPERTVSARALRGESSMLDDMEIVVGDRRVATASWGTPVRAPDGSVKYAIVAFQDITAEKQARADRQRLEEKLQQGQRLESIGRLAAGIAHDLNNMLLPIQAYAELAVRSLGSDDPVRAQVGAIRTAAQHAAEVTQQLLAFGRRQTLEVKALDLNREVREFERLVRRLIRENIALVLYIPGSVSI
jgi:predicted ATPase/GAF domain-containing protein